MVEIKKTGPAQLNDQQQLVREVTLEVDLVQFSALLNTHSMDKIVQLAGRAVVKAVKEVTPCQTG